MGKTSKKKKAPKIPKKYFKILKGPKRKEGEGLTDYAGLTKGTGLTKGLGLVLNKSNKSLSPIKIVKGSKKIIQTAQKGYSNKGDNNMTTLKRPKINWENQPGWGEDKGNKYKKKAPASNKTATVSRVDNKELFKKDPGGIPKSNAKTKTSTQLEYPKTTGAFKIQKGDTLTSISKMTGKSIDEIMKLNKDIKDKNKIRAGAGLKGLGTRADYTKKDSAVKTIKSDKKDVPTTLRIAKENKTITSKKSNVPTTLRIAKENKTDAKKVTKKKYPDKLGEALKKQKENLKNKKEAPVKTKTFKNQKKQDSYNRAKNQLEEQKKKIKSIYKNEKAAAQKVKQLEERFNRKWRTDEEKKADAEQVMKDIRRDPKELLNLVGGVGGIARLGVAKLMAKYGKGNVQRLLTYTKRLEDKNKKRKKIISLPGSKTNKSTNKRRLTKDDLVKKKKGGSLVYRKYGSKVSPKGVGKALRGWGRAMGGKVKW
tara:strand:+ start:174 stop:1616 length:1443 start_codon:yes stop_codon:yes gene_type:complete